MAEAGRRRRSGSPPSTSSMPDRPVTSAPSPYFPPELIPEVARRLTSLQDFFALRAACRAYRALLSLTTSNLASQAPLLLLTPHNLTQPHALFHLPLRRIHRFRLPHTTSIPDANDVAIRFHALGCRLAVSKSNYRCRTKRRISIIHLLTGEQACLPKPRAAISRLVLFGDLVVAWGHDDIHPDRFNIQYCRLGDPRWRMATISFPNGLEDMIFVKGTLYAMVNLNPGYRLAVVELPDDDHDNNLELVFLGCQIDTWKGDKSFFCLAECCGELLLVIGNLARFLILQWQDREREWLQITSLGGCSLFFADSCFSGCIGPDHPGIQGDCIYIAHTRECAVFSLIDQSADIVFVDNPRQAISDYRWPALWVFPSMC